MCSLSGYRAWVLRSVRYINTFQQYLFTKKPSAKNVVLAGVKSVTLYDPEPATLQDLSTQVGFLPSVLQYSASRLAQFFLRQEDIGKSRAEATLPRLAELNAYVPVRLLPGQPGQGISIDLVKGFQVHESLGLRYYSTSDALLSGGRTVQCCVQQTTRN